MLNDDEFYHLAVAIGPRVYSQFRDKQLVNLRFFAVYAILSLFVLAFHVFGKIEYDANTKRLLGGDTSELPRLFAESLVFVAN